jgi:hypothetical protein
MHTHTHSHTQLGKLKKDRKKERKDTAMVRLRQHGMAAGNMYGKNSCWPAAASVTSRPSNTVKKLTRLFSSLLFFLLVFVYRAVAVVVAPLFSFVCRSFVGLLAKRSNRTSSVHGVVLPSSLSSSYSLSTLLLIIHLNSYSKAKVRGNSSC